MPRAPSNLRWVNCAGCNGPFQTRHSQGKYCSDECSHEGEKASWRKYGANNQPARSTYQTTRYRENREQIGQRIKEYRQTEKGKEVVARAGENSRRKFPEKYAARQAVLVAVRAGILKLEPCAKCGTEKVEAHHRDYSKPLEIVWLCNRCHRQEHNEEQSQEVDNELHENQGREQTAERNPAATAR